MCLTIGAQFNIQQFKPHVPLTNPNEKPYVWAIDEQHVAHYYFPRDCPRIAYWISSNSSEVDRSRFFGDSSASRIIAIESRWYRRIVGTTLFRYHLPYESFRCKDQNAGYYVSEEMVTPFKVEPIDNLIGRVLLAGIELRIMPSLRKLYHALISSTIGYSMIRMRNAAEWLNKIKSL